MHLQHLVSSPLPRHRILEALNTWLPIQISQFPVIDREEETSVLVLQPFGTLEWSRPYRAEVFFQSKMGG